MIDRHKNFIASFALLTCVLLIPAYGATDDFHGKGYLIDIACGAVHRDSAGNDWEVVHSRNCVASELSSTAGFAMLLPNGTIYRFDTVGNNMAHKVMVSTKKDNDYKIEVEGTVKGNNLYVKTLQRSK